MSDDEKPSWEWKQRVEELTRDQAARIEAMHTLRNGYDATVAELEQQLAQVTAERDAFIAGGVTEELLRKQDGYLKVGRGCVIVREEEWAPCQYHHRRPGRADPGHERRQVMSHLEPVTESGYAAMKILVMFVVLLLGVGSAWAADLSANYQLCDKTFSNIPCVAGGVQHLGNGVTYSDPTFRTDCEKRMEAAMRTMDAVYFKQPMKEYMEEKWEKRQARLAKAFQQWDEARACWRQP